MSRLRVYINRGIDRRAAEREAPKLNAAQLIDLTSQAQRGVVVGRHARLAEDATRRARRCGLPGGPCVGAIIGASVIARSRILAPAGRVRDLRANAPRRSSLWVRDRPAKRRSRHQRSYNASESGSLTGAFRGPPPRPSSRHSPICKAPTTPRASRPTGTTCWEEAGTLRPIGRPGPCAVCHRHSPAEHHGRLAQRPRDVRGLPGPDDSLVSDARDARRCGFRERITRPSPPRR